MARTHYETLGVKRAATAQEIKSAYRKLVLAHHPDRSKDPASKAIFLQVTEAYEVLGNEIRRRMYDQHLDLVEQQRKKQSQQQKAPTSHRPTSTPRPRYAQTSSISIELGRLTLMYNRGQYSEAERLARSILRRDSRQAIPYAVLGDLARSKGDLDSAQQMYAYAAQMDPRNPVYQRRYEQLLSSSRVDLSGRRAHLRTGPQQLAMPVVAGGMVTASAIYLGSSAEAAAFGTFSFINTWTLGVLILLFLCGVVSGACLAIGNFLDRFEAANTTATGRYGPTVVLGLVAIVNFWVATLIYVLIGIVQKGFNYSTSRMVASVATVIALLAIGTQFGGAVDPRQLLLWGGNLTYFGALVGWLVADAFKGLA